MRVTLFVCMLTTLTMGCGKKKQSQTTDVETIPSGFIDIDLTEEEGELDDMVGSELRKEVEQCGDLVRLEPSALMGRLKDAEIRCLDRLMRESDLQTAKKKVSIVLMRDAWAKRDLHRWEGVVRRHLSEIDRSDPNLCYYFARHLSKKGPDYMQEAIKWANIALENRHSWEGDEFVDRVFNLHKMKAVAAHKEWQWLAEKYTMDPSDELDSMQQSARNSTKTLAREWLDYAREAERDTTNAYQLCISAAGTDGFCDETEEVSEGG